MTSEHRDSPENDDKTNNMRKSQYTELLDASFQFSGAADVGIIKSEKHGLETYKMEKSREYNNGTVV